LISLLAPFAARDALSFHVVQIGGSVMATQVALRPEDIQALITSRRLATHPEALKAMSQLMHTSML